MVWSLGIFKTCWECCFRYLWVFAIPSAHRKGVGKALLKSSEQFGKNYGYKYIQVKTVAMGHSRVYDLSNEFYLSLGFEPFEILPTLWDASNPCQIYLKAIELLVQRWLIIPVLTVFEYCANIFCIKRAK